MSSFDAAAAILISKARTMSMLDTWLALSSALHPVILGHFMRCFWHCIVHVTLLLVTPKRHCAFRAEDAASVRATHV